MGRLSRQIFGALRVGDKVEAVTRAVGIKPCGGCKKRKDWLNGVKNENVDADSKKREDLGGGK